MEKDFLGISRTDSGPDDNRGDRVDSAFPVGSVAGRSYTNQPSSQQQLIPFKSTQLDENPKPSFQRVCTSGSNTKHCAVQDPQISFGIDGNNFQQVSIHASTYLPPVSHASTSVAMNNPFFKAHGSSNAPNLTCNAIKPNPFRSPIPNNNSLFGSGVGSFAPWKVVRAPPTTRQLTIFYAGSVNVYDDVPWDKAQTIMHMAREACKASSFDDPIVAQSSSLVNKHVMASSPVLPSTLSLASQRGNQSGCCSMTIDVQEGVIKRAGTTVSASEDDPSKTMSTSMVAATAATILPRAVPQSRKASLARFLEKRKERVSKTAPYYADKKPSENSAGPDATAASSSSAAPPDFRTRNREFSLFRGQSKYSDDNDSPSTNLEM